jgi:hypothetical protein
MLLMKKTKAFNEQGICALSIYNNVSLRNLDIFPCPLISKVNAQLFSEMAGLRNDKAMN